VVFENAGAVLSDIGDGGGATDALAPMTERQVMTLEREAVISLSHRPATFARIEHMLSTGKPLKN
jgi:3-hydroxyacyl-CoA dehydrogenase